MSNNTTLTGTINQIASRHIDLSHQYGCRAFMVVVTFMYAGIAHRARKLVRSDMPGTGKIELYTLAPHAGQWTSCSEIAWYDSAFSEDWLGYVSTNPASRCDRLAHGLIEAATAGDVLGAEQAERFAMIECA